MKRFLIIFTLSTTSVLAQPSPPQFQPAPLDGGLIALLAAGAVYGTKKLSKPKKQ
jgi:hypothetical protein